MLPISIEGKTEKTNAEGDSIELEYTFQLEWPDERQSPAAMEKLKARLRTILDIEEFIGKP